MKICWLNFLVHLVFGKDIVPDTVPEDVTCTKVKRCDKYNVCAIVCAPGTVVMPEWLTQALALQRQLAYRNSFCSTQVPGSHNSGINLADGYGVEDHVFEHLLRMLDTDAQVHTNDQLFSLTDQLNFGVRFIELDVHWFDDDLHIAHCGGFHTKLLDDLIDSLNYVAKLLGWKIQWDSETIGCKPSLSSIPASEQRRLEDALIEIATWLNGTSNEFLVVFFDDEFDLSKWHKVERLLSYITRHFNLTEVYTPREYNDTAKLVDLMQNKKKIMFLSGAHYPQQGVLFDKNALCHWQEPELPLIKYPYCRFINPNVSKPNAGTILRPETSEIQYGFLNAKGQRGKNKHLLDENTIPDVIKCGVNIPSPDNLTPKRMEAFNWIVRPETILNTTDCFALQLNGYWTNLPSEQPCLAACRHGSIWRLGAKLQTHATVSCPEGFDLGIPTSGFENQQLVDLLTTTQATCVWLLL